MGKGTKLRFKATPGLRRYLYRKGGRRAEAKKGGKDALLVEPIYLADGDEIVEMDDFIVQWCLRYKPDNFEVVETPKKATKPDPETTPEDDS